MLSRSLPVHYRLISVKVGQILIKCRSNVDQFQSNAGQLPIRICLGLHFFLEKVTQDDARHTARKAMGVFKRLTLGNSSASILFT